MAAYYTLHIAGLTRELKICPISEKLDIAAFILFSDVELTEACARELAKRVPECDYILTAESKGIPLAYEMSRHEKCSANGDNVKHKQRESAEKKADWRSAIANL